MILLHHLVITVYWDVQTTLINPPKYYVHVSRDPSFQWQVHDKSPVVPLQLVTSTSYPGSSPNLIKPELTPTWHLVDYHQLPIGMLYRTVISCKNGKLVSHVTESSTLQGSSIPMTPACHFCNWSLFDITFRFSLLIVTFHNILGCSV